MSQLLRPSYVEINLTSLSKNYQIFVRSLLAQKFFCPMVKANAYGHGDVQIVQHLEKEGCKLFGVGLVEEGIRLREKAKSRSEILIFGFSGEDAVKELLHHCLTPVVSDFSQLELLEKNAQAPTTVHLKINTGMNRLGFQVDEVEKLLLKLQASKKIKVIGLCTHLMSAEDLMDHQGHSQEQMRQFQKVVEKFASFPITHFHAYNSSGAAKVFEMTDYSQQNAYGLRIGLGLYGLLTCESTFRQKLYPVMSLKSKIVATQKIKKGQSVSYGATWTADRDGWIGIVPLGYADGVPTQLSNKGIVQLGEKSLSIVGRVCMDYVMVDVTGVSDPIGKDVEFFGQKQTALEVAQKASTIGYDILTRISERVPRCFVN